MTSPLVFGHFRVQEPNWSSYRDENKGRTRTGIDIRCCKNFTALVFVGREEFVTEVSVPSHMTSPLVLGHSWLQEPNEFTYRDETFLLPAPALAKRPAKISLLSRLWFERSLSAKFRNKHI